MFGARRSVADARTAPGAGLRSVALNTACASLESLPGADRRARDDMAVTDPSSFFLRLWTSAHRGERVVARELSRAAAEVPQLAMLLLVELHEPASTTQLAEAIGVPFMTASDALSRLTDAGLAARAPNPRDRRSHLFSLTDAGRASLAATRAPIEQALARLEATGADVDALDTALEELNEALGQALRGEE